MWEKWSPSAFHMPIQNWLHSELRIIVGVIVWNLFCFGIFPISLSILSILSVISLSPLLFLSRFLSLTHTRIHICTMLWELMQVVPESNEYMLKSINWLLSSMRYMQTPLVSFIHFNTWVCLKGYSDMDCVRTVDLSLCMLIDSV